MKKYNPTYQWKYRINPMKKMIRLSRVLTRDSLLKTAVKLWTTANECT